MSQLKHLYSLSHDGNLELIADFPPSLFIYIFAPTKSSRFPPLCLWDDLPHLHSCLYSRDIDFLHRKSYIDSYTYSHTDHRLSHTLLYRLSHTFLNRLLYSIPSDLTLSLHYNFQCHHYKNITMELWQQFYRINAWGNTSKLTCFSMLSLHKSPPCQ